MFETVVVGADDSSTAAKAVDAAIDVVKLSGGSLHVVSAYKPAVRPAADVPDEYGSGVQPDSAVLALLEELSTRARASGVQVETHSRKGDPAEAVQEVASQVGADLVVVGSQGMHRRVLSSVPNSIAHNVSCAVLIVKTD